MKNLHKSLGTGAPAALSTGHRHYLRHYHFHRLLVIFFRIFLLTGFLFLWEFCASHQIIDSFIFMQSLQDHECFTLNDFGS